MLLGLRTLSQRCDYSSRQCREETTLFAYAMLKRCAFLRSRNVNEPEANDIPNGYTIEHMSPPRALLWMPAAPTCTA
jgi:hypothetical protein